MTPDEGPRFTLADVREHTYKRRDAWWTVLFVDPVASRLVVPVANRTRITPNQLTVAALVLGLLAAASFSSGSWPALAIGALLFHASFTLDCMDGKVARLKGSGSTFGAWLDYILDRIRILACTVALMSGQYARTGETAFLYLAVVVIFLDMLRYLDALQLSKIHEEMSGRLRSRPGATGSAPAGEDLDSPERAVLQQSFHRRFGWYPRVRAALAERRFRPQLFSGVEFQMFVFIVGPLLGRIFAVTVTSALLLLAFEAVIIYRLYLSTRQFDREMARRTGA